jgi:hypothetical protein
MLKESRIFSIYRTTGSCFAASMYNFSTKKSIHPGSPFAPKGPDKTDVSRPSDSH